ncbi:TetR/AcrR family transcriptional regulator [Embleya scabrispora]|uniref:TetR/AcrR family transcriptional regulator n=1 Tax=Embleya scabrispora TaxID=159449 RepID=UPI001914261E|nr:TetR/AcrR family transcriptional regulator [Embleya scabrispora]
MSHTPHEQTSPGRPRSEAARIAVLHAVDDMLVEQGYAAMTMKGIAERAGVGRQTVYRWWSTKAEILLEASISDAAHELATEPRPRPADDLVAFLRALTAFLTVSPAGLAYRALLGEAQHDIAVRDLVRTADLVGTAANAVLTRVRPTAPGMPPQPLAAAQLAGPVLAAILETGDPLPPPCSSTTRSSCSPRGQPPPPPERRRRAKAALSQPPPARATRAPRRRAPTLRARTGKPPAIAHRRPRRSQAGGGLGDESRQQVGLPAALGVSVRRGQVAERGDPDDELVLAKLHASLRAVAGIRACRGR